MRQKVGSPTCDFIMQLRKNRAVRHKMAYFFVVAWDDFFFARNSVLSTFPDTILLE